MVKANLVRVFFVALSRASCSQLCDGAVTNCSIREHNVEDRYDVVPSLVLFHSMRVWNNG